MISTMHRERQEAINPETPPERLLDLSKESSELMRLVAKNPSTPLHLLKTLSTSSDEMLCFAVTQNPSTPKTILFKLGERFPRALMQNPVLELFLLEDAGLLQWPEKTLFALLSLRELSPDFLEMMSGAASVVVRQRVAMHENTSLATLQRLVRDEEKEVHLSALKNPSFPQEVREVFEKATAWKPSNTGKNEPQFINKLSEEELVLLWRYGPVGKMLVRSHAETPPELLASLEKEP
jgi:hypothetical protein